MAEGLGVGICGLGTVGSGTFNLLFGNRAEIESKVGTPVEVRLVGCRRDHPDCDLAGTRVTRDIFDVVGDSEVDVVCELIGGTDAALEIVRGALDAGQHVVTANKALIAEHGAALFELAAEKGVQLRFEAAIAGGIPIVKAVREGLSGNRIEGIAGIINGTSNFILTEMSGLGNRGFDEVLAEAQELGYAEADPTFDVEGIDAAHKLTILSSIAFGVPLAFEHIYTEGISAVTVDDIRYAQELGYRLKHLGITRRRESGVELRVHPTLVPETELIAKVDGVMNAVLVSSDAAGTTLYYGAGAGSLPTASSVVADVIDVARSVGATHAVSNLGFAGGTSDARVLPIDETRSAFYLKLTVEDRPGVMASLSTTLSEHDISIESLIQKDASGGQVPIVLITNEVQESQFDAAVRAIESADYTQGEVTRIRVVAFN
tara:strand:+ start:3898 stop:5193 length:1296 start_codon:yes stop_codon:yes gene_type:complete